MTLTGQARTASALLEAKHQTTLEDFLREHRQAGLSYERIARKLDDLTDGAVRVTYQTIANWIDSMEAVA